MGSHSSMHPHFAEPQRCNPDSWSAYHVVSINYLDVATHEEAELFGAALHGLEIDDYYERVCTLADELGAPS